MIVAPLVGERELAQALPYITPHLQKMADRFPDDWPVTETLRRAIAGVLLLWLVVDTGEVLAVIGTERFIKPSGVTVLDVRFCGGRNARRWMTAARERIERHAAENACNRIEIEGRPGWARLLPGYRPLRTLTTLAKGL